VKRVEGGGTTQFVLDTRGGKLLAELGGMCDLIAGEVATPKVACHGQSRAKLAVVRDGGELSASGQSKTSADTAIGGRFTLSASGQSEVGVRGGHLDVITASASGQSEVSVQAKVGDATLTASGMSTIAVAAVSGQLSERKSGMSTIRIGQRPQASSGPTAPGGKSGGWW